MNQFIQYTMKSNTLLPTLLPARRLHKFIAGVVFTYSLLFIPACEAPPIVDLAAAELDVKINILDTQGSSPGSKAFATFRFLSNGKIVQLDGNASVTCNSEGLSWAGLFYRDWIPTAAAGGTNTFRHTRNQVTTEIIVPVQPRPVITYPAAGEGITRGTNIGMTYVPGGGTGMRGSASNSDASNGGTLQLDNGSYTGLDASSLAAGSGKLSLTREFKLPLPAGGFKSVEATYSSEADVKVNWN